MRKHESAADHCQMAGDARNQLLMRAIQSSNAKPRMSATPTTTETRVAALVDRDRVSPGCL
jgi:hypothetical protein